MKGDKEIRKLYKGETFGEAALYSEANRTMSVVASEDNVFIFCILKLIFLFEDQTFGFGKRQYNKDIG